MPSRILTSYTDLPSAAPRIAKIDIDRFKVAGYDIDNGYPQRMITLNKASPTAKMATELFADFIFGQGFSVSDGKTKSGKDKEDGVWNTIFNSKGHTGDDLLSLCAIDYSRFEKFYLHLNYNALFHAVELGHIPYEFVRYGIGDEDGKIALYDRWWTNDRFGKLNIKTDLVDYIDIFNSDPVAIKQQVSQAGGWKTYKGQIAGFGKGTANYPEYTLDAALDAIEGEILALKTTKSNIKNNFGDKVLWIEKGEFQSKTEEQDFTESVKEFIGPDGAQVIISAVKNSIDEAPEFKTIENRLDDKKFAYSQTLCRSTIYRLLGQNAILHSDLTEGRYNQNQLPEAIKAYNNRTERARINLQRAFSTVLSVMGITADCAITPINEESFAINNTQGAGNGSNNTTDNSNGL